MLLINSKGALQVSEKVEDQIPRQQKGKLAVIFLISNEGKRKIMIYFLAFTSTKIATTLIIPPNTKSTCTGKPPVAVVVPAGA